MIFDSLEGLFTKELTGLEKLSGPVSTLDMQRLNDPLDFMDREKVFSGTKAEGLNHSETAERTSEFNSREVVDNRPIVPPIASHPIIEPIEGAGGLAKVTDIFGNTRVCDPNMVDVFSGLPVTVPDYLTGNPSPNVPGSMGDPGHIPFINRDQWKRDNADQIIAIRDAAVEHYKDAKSRGDIQEMLKWEAEANKQEGILMNVLGISGYGLSPKAPGIS